jgi:CTP synthase (UTP-ammonia lyase)
MPLEVRIALVGDFDAGVVAHRAIEQTLILARERAFPSLAWQWLHTAAYATEGPELLESCQGVWCVPATPYANMENALAAIRYARESDRPFLGTCGGFQHALIEYARNVLGRERADHAETNPDADELIIVPLACALVEETRAVILRGGTMIRTICGVEHLMEGYHCRYGVSPGYRALFEQRGLTFGAEDEDGDVRSFELPGHPFFLGTLFQPERAALKGHVHPICMALLDAAHGRAGALDHPSAVDGADLHASTQLQRGGR